MTTREATSGTVGSRVGRQAASARATTALPAAKQEAAVDLLVRAFQHDPMMTYLTGGEEQTLGQAARRFYGAAIALGLRDGHVDVTPDLDGIAIWIRPGRTDFSMTQMLRAGLLTAVLRMGPASVGRFLRAQAVNDQLSELARSRRHWYLMFLAVDPSRQGQGIGASLIRTGLDRADADGLPCHLDSTNERNLTFYQRLGFVMTGRARVSGGPVVWAMAREPAPGSIGTPLP